MLWETALGPTASKADAGDVDGVASTDTLGVAAAVDVHVVIQRGFWLRGRGLEVELAGDVRVRQSGLTPTLVGSLEAVRGQLELLGRRLGVERGVATFYGGDELDPALDIALSTRIDDTLVRVTVSGTATAPELTLGSEPAMTEGDIMSLLVLGRRLDDLDDDQAGLLADRAAEVATQLGAARVQAALGKRLGVDIIAIQQGSGPGAEESLVVGKYLTEKILVKYEQALQGSAGFLVNLEYLLTRHLRVETLSGEGRSGVEMNWANEY
jgi:translocation and assembly module TamB